MPAMPQRRRLLGAYDSEVLDGGKMARPPGMGAQPNPAALVPMPIQMAGGEGAGIEPTDPLNPLNVEDYLGVKKRRLPPTGGML